MKKYEIKIVQDTDPDNPRHDDNVSRMICFHKRYELGDRHDFISERYGSWDELKDEIMKDSSILMIKPLYMYEHSGITISTSPFGCQWDSGQIGWVFIDEEHLKSICGEGEYSNEEIEEWIKGEVETYDKYLSGDVWIYQIYEVITCNLGHEHKNIIESCGGYYGYDECMTEAESLLKHYELEVG
jgi:hypothetical protein